MILLCLFAYRLFGNVVQKFLIPDVQKVRLRKFCEHFEHFMLSSGVVMNTGSSINHGLLLVFFDILNI